MKTALVTGITGQDGSYLTELLLDKGYVVWGLVRRTSAFNRERLDHICNPNLKYVYGDIIDMGSILHALKVVQPDEVYHLAAQSHVGISFDTVESTLDMNTLGTARLLEAVRLSDVSPRIYNAATSELFGGMNNGHRLSEKDLFHPRSTYAVSKLASYWMMCHYRETYGLPIWNGILFNHESPRRGENFVTRKITLSIAKIMMGLQKELVLGNMDACRDWGYAPDYVESMWLMLQSSKPDDFVVATGEMHSVREFFELAMTYAGEVVPVRVDEYYRRPLDVDALCGDSSKARSVLGWCPKVGFPELVRIMMEADIAYVRKNQ